MPIYAYKCSACGFAKDALQKMSDAPLTVCPNCGASAFEKQVTAAGFQLKGSGWYVTDFRDGGGKKSEPASAPASGDAPQIGRIVFRKPCQPRQPHCSAEPRAGARSTGPRAGSRRQERRLTPTYRPPCSPCANGCSPACW
jgi:putative FmdB family regulatory protein